ncbi:MAG: hypothetical protein FIA99_09415 [Ruminiclostridium sp.]|nr:hypothetical protein [Ruminiclostridium sp.]
MNQLNYILLLSALAGLTIILIGLFYRLYARQKSIHDLTMLAMINNLALAKLLKPVFDFITGNRKGLFYRTASKMLVRAESGLTVQALYLVKFISLILAAILVLFIRYTNVDLTRQSIIAKPAASMNVFTGQASTDYARNVELYEAILKKIGEQNLKKLDDNSILEKAGKVLPEILKDSDHSIIVEQAAIFLSTYRKISSITLFDYWSILAIILSFWLPEAFLLVKRLLLTGMYRKEVIKLENIFELLGSVQGIKTFDILKEMAKASGIYKKHLTGCMEHFKTEKEEALESLKAVVRNKRFSRLVDVMRVFSMTDRKLAMQILERNRLEQEEDLLITAEEDVDAVDLIAFISIVPVVWLLINLLLKPMLDTIFEVFKYV